MNYCKNRRRRKILRMNTENRLLQQFAKYVSQSIAGMIGISIYILADTFFIARHSGADGLTVLNLALPVYGLIFAIGAMIGIGSATRYAIRKAQGEKNIDHYFTSSVLWCAIISIPFILLGIFVPEQVMKLMGADETIIRLGVSYFRIFLGVSPFFMINYTFTAFARNDHAPTLVMIASLCGSSFNILFDYLFMFPCGMGLAGAALATALSPVVTMMVCCIHYFGKNCSVGFQWRVPSIRHLAACCQFGVPSFVGEISSAVTTAVFNMLILGIAGNTGIAAYGVIANISLVAMSIFNGISQGTQPLTSNYYGSGNTRTVKTLLKSGIFVTILAQAVIIGGTWGFTDLLIGIFNSEGNALLLQYAHDGMRLYFLGYALAGINILLAGYFSATGRITQAFAASISRGVVAIVICAVIMAKIWGMNGVWLSFLAAEVITFAVILVMNRKEKH